MEALGVPSAGGAASQATTENARNSSVLFIGSSVLLDRLDPAVDFRPIHELRVGRDVVPLLVLVVHVEGVLVAVDHDERDPEYGDTHVVDVRDEVVELAAHGVL